MLQTVDFLKFPEEPLFQTRQYKWVFDRVVQYRNFAKSENSQEIFPVESVFRIVIDSKLKS